MQEMLQATIRSYIKQIPTATLSKIREHLEGNNPDEGIHLLGMWSPYEVRLLLHSVPTEEVIQAFNTELRNQHD